MHTILHSIRANEVINLHENKRQIGHMTTY